MASTEFELNLSAVSKTGLLTAFCHAIDSASASPVLRDPHGEAVAQRLAPVLAQSGERLLQKIAARKISTLFVAIVALRARYYDRVAREFYQTHPGGCVVNLGCGLDTRFWRVDEGRGHVVDLDLPEVMKLKQTLVPSHERHHSLGISVLDFSWMDRLAQIHPGPYLFFAEGLTIYLLEDQVRALVLTLQKRFSGSEFVFDVSAPPPRSRVIKWVRDRLIRRQLGVEPEAMPWSVRHSRDVEAWGKGLSLIEEWTPMQENDRRLSILRALAKSRPSENQGVWTVRYRLGAP